MLSRGAVGLTLHVDGVYSSAQYHFTVTYPSGWVANEVQAPLGSPQASSTATPIIPLTLVITQTSANTSDTALLSAFTVTVLNAALSDGRLTHEEHDERVHTALSARTLGDLVGLTTDLVMPSGQPIQLDSGPVINGIPVVNGLFLVASILAAARASLTPTGS